MPLARSCAAESVNHPFLVVPQMCVNPRKVEGLRLASATCLARCATAKRPNSMHPGLLRDAAPARTRASRCCSSAEEAPARRARCSKPTTISSAYAHDDHVALAPCRLASDWSPEVDRRSAGRCSPAAARSHPLAAYPLRGKAHAPRFEHTCIQPLADLAQEAPAWASPRAIARRLNAEGCAGARRSGGMGRHHDPRPCHAWRRHPQQRALPRPAGLEPAALRQGPEHE